MQRVKQSITEWENFQILIIRRSSSSILHIGLGAFQSGRKFASADLKLDRVSNSAQSPPPRARSGWIRSPGGSWSAPWSSSCWSPSSRRSWGRRRGWGEEPPSPTSSWTQCSSLSLGGFQLSTVFWWGFLSPPFEPPSHFWLTSKLLEIWVVFSSVNSLKNSLGH